MMVGAVNVPKVIFLALLTATGLGTALYYFVPWTQQTQVQPMTEQRKEVLKQELVRIASIKDDKAREAELRGYVGSNPGGPFLNVAYGLLLESLYRTDQTAAMDLADRILGGYTDPAEGSLRSPAYQLKLAVLATNGRSEEAASLAKTVLSKESDPTLLRFASQFDPASRAQFESRIADLEARDQERARQRELEELLGLPYLEWESKTVAEKTGYLQALVLGASNPGPNLDKRQRLIRLLRMIVEHLNQSGEGAQALVYLDQVVAAGGSEDHWYFWWRGRSLELTSDFKGAGEAYIRAFAASPREPAWQKVRVIAAKAGSPISAYVEKAARLMADSGGAFASFDLRTPQGRRLRLSDIPSRSVLVSFFFPS